MPDRETVLKSNAHKHFWVYVAVFSVLIGIMVVYSSYSQEQLKLEKQEISEQLTEEKNFSKGIQKTAKDISEQNDKLQQENKQLQEEISVLEQRVSSLQQQNENYEQNQAVLKQLKEAYVAGDKETCQTLLTEIDESLIPLEEQDQFLIIKKDLQ